MRYEISFLTLVFLPFFVTRGYTIFLFCGRLANFAVSCVAGLLMFFLFVCETNRSPFDFAEAERELVSGFNTEYGGLTFAFLFLGEYGKILFRRTLLVLMFVSGSPLFTPLFTVRVSLLFLLIRGAFPRFRYDLLMQYRWQVVLPVRVALLMYFLVL